MTLELQETLERGMEDALKIEDAARRSDAVLTVLSHQMRALVDCQRKTSDRVKQLLIDRDRDATKAATIRTSARILWAVIGALFGNTGTGAFTYGNDLMYPIPAD